MTEGAGTMKMDEFLQEHLPFFDELLSSTNVPLNQRPLRAAFLFVQHCVIAVEGDKDKEHPLGKRWFKLLYEAVVQWYAARYSGAMRKKDSYALALISVFNTPFRVQVPLTLVEPEENNQMWVTFPKEVLPSENVLEWITNPPNFQTKGRQELSDLSDNIIQVATATREGVKSPFDCFDFFGQGFRCAFDS